MESWGREEFTAMEEKLVEALRHKMQGETQPSSSLLPPVVCFVHDLNVLAFHPQELYDEYKMDNLHAGDGGGGGLVYYFFGPMELHSVGENGSPMPPPPPPPPRTTKDGGIWKACGGACKIIDAGGGRLGQKVMLVYYERGSSTRSEWGMDEYTTTDVAAGDLCLRRVYRRDETWEDEQRRRVSSTAVRAKILARIEARSYCPP
ncbi:uncharacterized protein LOC127782017 [Oryza glaberrima]|uniref:uncharacterized protein LOC127782017 n=1 Tax=Oryza glaberrima TaxID=4538 RepID=UPI00224BF815|nr:uncharacterized protein LOC127782017 [Oryza glaberrima]